MTIAFLKNWITTTIGMTFGGVLLAEQWLAWYNGTAIDTGRVISGCGLMALGAASSDGSRPYADEVEQEQ